MKFSKFGRISMALAASVALALSMTACGGGTIGYMWVVGTTSTSSAANQIVGFKIDDYTGNLTAAPRSPFSSAGSNPANILVRPGGRFVYVINQGTTTNGVSNRDGNISEFSVGGDGTLTFQETYTSQGGSPVWAAMDSAGSYLYVLDSIAPAGTSYATAGVGDITVFSVASDTGRLALVTNQQTRDSNNVNLNFFPVGPAPVMVKVASSGCLYTLDKNQAADPYATYVFPYQIGSGGQLTSTVTSQIATGASHLTSINVGGGNGTGTSTGGTYFFATDVGPQGSTGTPTTAGHIFEYTSGTSCSLNAVTGNGIDNISPAQYPVWAQTDSSGKFLYVLNQSNSNSSNVYSSISSFVINQSTGQLSAVSDTSNPYAIGSGPTCMAEDPTNQYLYTSNSGDGNVTGKIINTSTGQLSDLRRGSKFTAVTHASCLAISGSVD